MTSIIQTFIGALAFFSTFVSATASGYQISHLSTHRSNIGVINTQNVTLSFLIHDPNPLTNSSALCGATWPENGTVPSGGYARCGNTTFGWNFADNSYTSIYDFTLQLEHAYADPAVGQPPYDKIVNFAHATISRDNVTCASVHNRSSKGEYHCEQIEKTIEAPIWATIA
ncbi:hypothetical protein BDV97DRAFT_205312 [Delphinella strobiligena]|nr:hypothetical protein BDV97DRAFT_205312 [Delphinella strobiligena]